MSENGKTDGELIVEVLELVSEIGGLVEACLRKSGFQDPQVVRGLLTAGSGFILCQKSGRMLEHLVIPEHLRPRMEEIVRR